MIRGSAKMVISEATVLEAMQEWARVNFLAGHIPKVTGFRAEGAANYGGGSSNYELTLQEAKDDEGDAAA
jgi:hypothetical protein